MSNKSNSKESERYLYPPQVGRVLRQPKTPSDRDTWWNKVADLAKEADGDWIEILNPPVNRTSIYDYIARGQGRNSRSVPDIFYDPMFEAAMYRGVLWVRYLKDSNE